MTLQRAILVGLLLSVTCLVPGQAQDTPSAAEAQKADDNPEDTSPSFRDLLNRWETLPPEKQVQLINEFRRLRRLDPEERRRLMQNYRDYADLSPREKALLQKRARQLAALSPEQRRTVREAYDRWKDLDDDHRRRLRKLWKDLKVYLPGDLARLKRASDDPDQRERIISQVVGRLQLLESMPADKRAEIDKMPPRQRQRVLVRMSAARDKTPD